MTKKNNMFFILGVIVIIIVGGFFVFGSSNFSEGDILGATTNGEFQKVIIGMRNFNYYPQEIRVKVNQPVEITLDDSVFGCYRDFMIKEFSVRKYSRTLQDKIIFTPTKTGTFVFTCSMNMGTGRLIVEQNGNEK